MKHQAWDDAIRQRAAKERLQLTPEAEARFEAALRAGRCAEETKKNARAHIGRSGGWALALGCALAALLVLATLPLRDTTRNSVSVIEQPEGLVPLTEGRALAPRVEMVSVLPESAAPRVEGRFANETGETWLIAWSATLDSEPAQEKMLWLESGSECTDRATWQAKGKQLRWEYRGYRITAPILHWVDGEPRTPEEDGYEDQQSLMEAALEANALILAPGDWENGQAGEMRVLLPDSYLRLHPEDTPLDYCVRAGLLEEAFDLCQNEEEYRIGQD